MALFKIEQYGSKQYALWGSTAPTTLSIRTKKGEIIRYLNMSGGKIEDIWDVVTYLKVHEDWLVKAVWESIEKPKNTGSTA